MTILKKSANIKSTNKTDETNTHLKRGKMTGENEEIIVMTRKLRESKIHLRGRVIEEARK